MARTEKPRRTTLIKRPLILPCNSVDEWQEIEASCIVLDLDDTLYELITSRHALFRALYSEDNYLSSTEYFFFSYQMASEFWETLSLDATDSLECGEAFFCPFSLEVDDEMLLQGEATYLVCAKNGFYISVVSEGSVLYESLFFDIEYLDKLKPAVWKLLDKFKK